jgi:hypothetical protein
MAWLIPETLTRLQATAFASGAEISAIGRSEIIRACAENMVQSAVRKLMDDCITTEDGYMGYKGQALRLDVYVLSPAELQKMLSEARTCGKLDALRWERPEAS